MLLILMWNVEAPLQLNRRLNFGFGREWVPAVTPPLGRLNKYFLFYQQECKISLQDPLSHFDSESLLN